MKPYFLLPLLFFFNFALSQEVYNAKTVDQFPIYPTCQDSINDLPNCFDKKLNEDVQKKLSAIKLDKIIKASGRIFTKVNFVDCDKQKNVCLYIETDIQMVLYNHFILN